MPIADFIIAVFCCVEEMLPHLRIRYPLRQRGCQPKLCDSGVLTMEIVGEFLGIDADKHIWRN